MEFDPVDGRDLPCAQAGSRSWRRGRAAANALGVVMSLLAGLVLLPASAHAWWNEEWALRKKITIDTSSVGANITDPIGAAAPVLVRLHSGNFRFVAAKDDGSDIRFVAADDHTPLKFHIEKYDSLLGEALVWVNVPDVKPGVKTEFWLYYGNRKAVPVGDPKGTYDADTVLVYHFAERGAPPQDSSVWANHAQSAGRVAEGALIGQGLRLDGTMTVTIPGSPPLAVTDGAPFTWSAWINLAAPLPRAVLYSRHDGANALIVGIDDTVPFVEVTGGSGTQRSAPGPVVAPGGWHHLAVTGDGTKIELYLDGNSYASLAAALSTMAGPATIGGDTATPAQPEGSAAPPATTPTEASPPATSAPAAPASPAVGGFVGDIDELQISKIARSAGFIKFAAVSQGPDPGKLIGYGPDEETSSWLSGYFAVILKSVTLDGWVVIGLLAIMAVISWIVMIDKVSYVNRQGRANAHFMRNFRAKAGDLTVLDHGEVDDEAEEAEEPEFAPEVSAADRKMMRNSSLYRIYHIGAEELSRRFSATARERVLSAQAIAAIRAGLDSGFLKETQRLNRALVVLTIAISGGPFLGLLGTVIGVMITFAAIAASGDVNVNAIAPGIAAALVATVAGLGVAIPALFGYNYLVTRIKDLTSDMQVFIDEFVSRMAENYQPSQNGIQSMAAE